MNYQGMNEINQSMNEITMFQTNTTFSKNIQLLTGLPNKSQ